MNTEMCAIYDVKIKAYMRPFQAQSIGQATRMFEDLLNDPNHDITKHPEDYSLFHLATFDDQTGEFTNVSPPYSLARAHEVLALLKADKG